MSPRLANKVRDYIDTLESAEELEESTLGQGSNVQAGVRNLYQEHGSLFNSVLDVFLKLRIVIRAEYQLEVLGDSGYQLRKIHGTTRVHTDGAVDDTYVRNLSVIICLNNDYSGGEISFPKQNIRFRMKKGDIVIFPPYWTHPHQVYPPNATTYRYTINTWLYDGTLNTDYPHKLIDKPVNNIY